MQSRRTVKSNQRIHPKREITIALAGNPNVGKSVIFNQITGGKQIVGNWPGKTVERCEGVLYHHGRRIRVIDLPGIYSLSGETEDARIATEYILSGEPDVLINIIDATNLERNLFLTLQMIETERPMVVILNLMDIAKKKGISIDCKKLEEVLSLPVIPTVAITGYGVHKAIDLAINAAIKNRVPPKIKYGTEVEERIRKIADLLPDLRLPRRYVAIRCIEGDDDILRRLEKKSPERLPVIKKLLQELRRIHGEPPSVIIASERYALSARITEHVQRYTKHSKREISEVMDTLTMHYIAGYVILFLLMFLILGFIILFGGWVSQEVMAAFEGINPHPSDFLGRLAWDGGVVGVYSALSVMLGFILPFYIILGVLEDSGYLPKVAFLMDSPCHALGLHGKATIPLLLAFGCNVPACLGCRIMDSKRDKLITTVVSTLVPCSARSAVVFGLVGVYVGIWWAFGLYVFDFVLIFLVARLLNRVLRGHTLGIIMEIPPFRMPSIRTVLRQAWIRFRPFLIIAFPTIVLGSLLVEYLSLTGALTSISQGMSPLTVVWLGLPSFAGILFIFGILRKEAALALLATAAGTPDLVSVMSPIQMVVFALVVMTYTPCISTLAVLVKETGWKKTIVIALGITGLSLFAGGIAFRVLDLLF